MSKILIIDDNADIRRLIRWSLEPDGHDFQEARTADAGLAAARLWHPDLILLDVMMPGNLTGLDACRQLKDDPELCSTPVVLLTARAREQDRAAGTAAGADLYLVKPFSPTSLLDAVEQLLNADAGAAPPTDAP